MNSVLNSLSSSPIANVMLKDSSMDSFIYNLESAFPSCTREKVELDIPNVGFSKKVSVDLPKYGMLAGLVLKLSINIAKSGTNYVAMAQNFLLLLQSAVLTGHSREICELSGIANFAKILEMDKSSKDAILNAALYSLSNLTGTAAGTNEVLFDGTYSLYIPLFFPFFDKLSTLLDMEFVEPINLSFTLGADTQIFKQKRSSSISATDSKLLVYYYQMSENDNRRRQDMMFSTEKPLSVLSYSSYPEVPKVSPVTAVSKAVAGVSETIKLNTPNLLVSTTVIVRCTKDGADVLSQALIPVDTIEFKGNGKSLYKYTFDEFALENCIFSQKKGTYNMSQYKTGLNPAENVFTHYWAMSDSHDLFSGGVSAKNLSDFSVTVAFSPPDATTDNNAMEYTIEVVHTYVNIVSYSGNSGKIGVSMAL